MWPKPYNLDTQDLVFFDTDCSFCHKWVRFLVNQDKGRFPFKFGSRKSPAFAQVVEQTDLKEFPESILVWTSKRELLSCSTAVAYMLCRLGGFYRILGELINLVPAPLRDFGYSIVAKLRKKFSRKPETACPLVPPEMRNRFLE